LIIALCVLRCRHHSPLHHHPNLAAAALLVPPPPLHLLHQQQSGHQAHHHRMAMVAVLFCQLPRCPRFARCLGLAAGACSPSLHSGFFCLFSAVWIKYDWFQINEKSYTLSSFLL
jgi:hypothetical protein